MPANNPPELGETFRDLVTQWEREFNAFANQIMGTEGFSRAMNSAQNSQLGAQQLFSDAMARHFAAMNLPSRDDILSLAQTVQEIARRIERIETLLDDREAAASGTVAPAGPPRTKRPPAEYSNDAKPA